MAFPLHGGAKTHSLACRDRGSGDERLSWRGTDGLRVMRVLAFLLRAVAAAVLVYSMLWGALALWFRLPLPEPVKYAAIGLLVIPGVLALVHLFTRRTRRSLVVYAVLFAALLVWWQTLKPPAEADFAADVARQVTGRIEGDILTLDGVRAFEWRSPEDVTEIWAERTYDLSELATVDVFLSYWGNPAIAHFMVSFGFGDGTYLAWSVEVRRLRDGRYSPVADFFKANPLVVIAAEEYDVVGMRSNMWENDVYIFPLRLEPAAARDMLEGYVYDANLLAAAPVWYNSVLTNCTTVVVKTLAAFGHRVPFDWRLVVNGYLPEMLHARDRLVEGYSVEELRALGRIAERAREAGLGPQYSEAIRRGVPQP